MNKYYILSDPTTGKVTARYDDSLGYKNIPAEVIEVDESVFNLSIERGDTWVFDSASSGLIPKPPKSLLEQLLDAENKKLYELADKYSAQMKEPIAFLGTTFDADDRAKNNLKDVLTAFSSTTLPTGFFWIDATNAQVPVTFSDVEGLAKAIGDRSWVLFQKFQELKSKTKAASTLEEVEAILW